MSGYLRFKMTGKEPIDKILRVLKQAGDLYHHTEQWTDGCPSLVDLIQAAADEAAGLPPKGATGGGSSGDDEDEDLPSLRWR